MGVSIGDRDKKRAMMKPEKEICSLCFKPLTKYEIERKERYIIKQTPVLAEVARKCFWLCDNCNEVEALEMLDE